MVTTPAFFLGMAPVISTLEPSNQILVFIIKICSSISPEERKKQENEITKTILEILDFSFFPYSVSPMVNTTIKLCMILSKLTKYVKIKGNFNYGNRHLILKKIYDDTFLVLRKNRSSENTQVETLYLLILLKELGREYRLDEQSLCDYCTIDLAKKKCAKHLNYFSIVVLLFYIEDKVRYARIKEIDKNADNNLSARRYCLTRTRASTR
ncbi:hypothetical protein ACFLWZ_07585 [Chloroflexota bacterium]